MPIIHLKLSYPQLSQLLEDEINKNDIVFKGYDIAIRQLAITAVNRRIRITGKIDSKWDAFFDFSAAPLFRPAVNRVCLEDLELDLDAKNLIFKGILKLARGNIMSRIEKMIESPLDKQLLALRTIIDRELTKAPLPYNLNLSSDTKSVKIKEILALTEHLSISAEVDMELNVYFKEKPETLA